MNKKKFHLAGEVALLIVLLINSLGVDLMSKSGFGISTISSVPLVFNIAFPVFSFGTWNYIFQTLLVITLMKDVDEILGAYLRLEERAVGLRTEEKTVRIGSVYPLAPGTIPHMLKEFGATFPFIIYNRMTPEIAEGLLDGKYDIGFCSDLLKSDEIEYYPIRDSYIAVVVPKGHPLENRERISLKETAGYPQIMFSKTSGFRTLQEQIFAEEGIKVKPVCAAEEIEVITGLVENGFGISVLPYMDIVRLHNVVTIPVKTSGWNSKFYIARRKYGIRSEQEEAFFQYWKKKHH